MICTVVILGGGDSGSVSKTVVAPTPRTAAAAIHQPAPPAPTSTAPPPRRSRRCHRRRSPRVDAEPDGRAAAPTAGARRSRAAAGAGPRTITYPVTGNRQLLDLVTVIYTDAAGRSADRRQRRAAVVARP